MKLINPEVDFQIEFLDNILNVLILENPVYFRATIIELLSQKSGEDGKVILSNDNLELDFKSLVEVIINPLELNLNERKILNRLYSNIENQSLDEDKYLKTMEFLSRLENYIIEILEDIDYPLEYNSEVNLSQIYKAMDLKMEEKYDSYMEKLFNYISVVRELLGIELFIFINLKSYLSKEDYENLYSFISYNKINILLIEKTVTEESYEWEKNWIIDKDICEIY